MTLIWIFVVGFVVLFIVVSSEIQKLRDRVEKLERTLDSHGIYP